MTHSDDLKGRLFNALVESVLLYNAESWTLTDALEKQLDGVYCSLLRAAFRIHYPPHLTTNIAISKRANLTLPSVTETAPPEDVGHVLRARSYCPEPLQDFFSLQAPY